MQDLIKTLSEWQEESEIRQVLHDCGYDLDKAASRLRRGWNPPRSISIGELIKDMERLGIKLPQ